MNNNIILYTIKEGKNKIKVGTKYATLITDTPAFGEMEFKISLKDVQSVRKHRWRAMRVSKDKIYAYSATAGYLHRFIMNPPENLVVDHVSHNTLDNTRDNLRVCTTSENNANKSNTKFLVAGITELDNGKYRVRIRKGQSYYYSATVNDLDEAIRLRLINEIRLGFLAHSHLYVALLTEEDIDMAAKDYFLNLAQGRTIETVNTDTIRNMIKAKIA